MRCLCEFISDNFEALLPPVLLLTVALLIVGVITNIVLITILGVFVPFLFIMGALYGSFI